MTTFFAPSPDGGRRHRGEVAIALAAVAWSTAGAFQRELALDTTTQVAGRAFFAMIALLAYVAVNERGRVLQAFRAMGLAELGFAVSIAVASASFIVALNNTTVANVLFLQATSPIVAALLARVFLGEGVARRTWAAMILGLAGVSVMIGGPGGGDPVGIGSSVIMTLAFSVAIVITRYRRDISMAPGTCVAQLLVLAAVAPFAHPVQIGSHDLVFLMLLGSVQMGLGLALLTVGARFIPAAEIALITLLEVVLGPLWVWMLFAETPSAATFAGGAVIIAAVAIQAGGRRGTRAALAGQSHQSPEAVHSVRSEP